MLNGRHHRSDLNMIRTIKSNIFPVRIEHIDLAHIASRCGIKLSSIHTECDVHVLISGPRATILRLEHNTHIWLFIDARTKSTGSRL